MSRAARGQTVKSKADNLSPYIGFAGWAGGNSGGCAMNIGEEVTSLFSLFSSSGTGSTLNLIPCAPPIHSFGIFSFSSTVVPSPPRRGSRDLSPICTPSESPLTLKTVRTDSALPTFFTAPAESQSNLAFQSKLL